MVYSIVIVFEGTFYTNKRADHIRMCNIILIISSSRKKVLQTMSSEKEEKRLCLQYLLS